MPNVIVGISDCQWSTTTDSNLITYALGSCIAVSVYDPRARVGGLLHFMLPEASLNPEKAQENPYTFADSGIPVLFKKAYELGAIKNRMVVHAVGGAQVMVDQELFNIGKRNQMALRKLLWKAGVMLQAEAVGGNISRTVRLEMATGKLFVKESGGVEFELLGSGK
jgi:chemotaxis protein CheD